MTRLFVVNVLLGIPGILYFWMLFSYLHQGALLTMGGSGLAQRMEGYFSSNQVLGPPLAIGVIVWVLVNVYLVNRRKHSGQCLNASGKTVHWLTALGSTLLPPALLVAVLFAL